MGEGLAGREGAAPGFLRKGLYPPGSGRKCQKSRGGWKQFQIVFGGRGRALELGLLPLPWNFLRGELAAPGPRPGPSPVAFLFFFFF